MMKSSHPAVQKITMAGSISDKLNKLATVISQMGTDANPTDPLCWV